MTRRGKKGVPVEKGKNEPEIYSRGLFTNMTSYTQTKKNKTKLQSY